MGSSSLAIYVILILVGLGILAKGADIFTEGAKKVAKILGMSHASVGILIVSLSTTFPEVVVSLYAAATGQPGLAFGNAIGSIVANAAFVLAINGFISTTKVSKQVIYEDIPFLIFLTAISWGLSYSGDFTRIDGLIVFAIAMAYYVYRFRSSSNFNEEEAKNGKKKTILLLIFGAALVLIGAKLVKDYSYSLALSLGVPEVIIGITIVAIGTSIPELATNITTSLKKLGEIGLGNIIGANIIDVGIALGLSAVVSPIGLPMSPLDLKLTYPIALISFAILEIGLLLGKKLCKAISAPLISLYAIYLYLLISGFTLWRFG